MTREEMSPAERQDYDEAILRLATVIGTSILTGQSPEAVVQEFEDVRNKVVRQLIVDSRRPEGSPLICAIDVALRQMRLLTIKEA